MRIRMLCIGESKVLYLREGEEDFLNRLKHYTDLQIGLVRPVRHAKSKSDEQILKEEADLILEKTGQSGFVVALDSRGKMFTSEQFASRILDWQNQGMREIIFVIGGPLGLHANVLNRADLVLSISKMTFTHDMIRLILLEQIYRAYTILKGEKYHK